MTRYFVRHPVMTWMLFTAFVVLGLYAVPRLEVEAIPDVDLPSLTIRTLWNGASPQAVQRSITLPIEEAARRDHGVEHVRSTSRAGRSTVQVEFAGMSKSTSPGSSSTNSSARYGATCL